MKVSNLVLLCFFSISVFSQTGSLRGKVTDAESGQPLDGVNVILRGTDFGAATDDQGNYSIENIPVGIYEISFSFIGYTQRILPDILIKSNRIVYQNCELQWTSIEGEEVTVTSGYFENSQNSVVSAQSLTSEEIRRAPGARGDVSRVLQNLPGVNPSSDDRNDLLVRGGSPTEVLYMIDGIEVGNPNHFGTLGSTGGPITMISDEFVENIDFYSGGFTSDYGNKLSGVMDIRLREGSRNETNGKLDLNFGGAGGYIETPLGGKGSVLLGVHRSFLDLLKGVLDYGGVPVYSTLEGKITYDVSGSQKLSLIFLGGDDKINLEPEFEADDFHSDVIDTVDDSDTKFKSQQAVAGLTIKSFWTSSFYTSFSSSFDYNRYSIDENVKYVSGRKEPGKDEIIGRQDLYELDEFDNYSTEKLLTLNYSQNLLIGKSTLISSGAYSKMNTFDYNIEYRPADKSPDKYGNIPEPYKIRYEKNNELKYGGFINWNQKIQDKFVLNAGVRLDRFEIINSRSLSPRLNFEYKITGDVNFHTAFGIYYQNPEMIWILSHPENRDNLKDIKCTHYIAGFDYIILPGLKLTVEGFFKQYENYPVSADDGREMISLANTGTGYGQNISSQKLVSKGSGKGYGIEFMLQKKMSDNIYGLLSYSYSDIKHKALDGILRRGAYDNRNVLNAILGYRITDSYEVSAKFRYAGGCPFTPYDMNASVAAGHGLYDLSAINTAEYPSYQRFDIRFDHRDFFESGTLIEYISVENMFNRKNVLSHSWDNRKHDVKFNYQISLFIIGGISYEF